jgi:primary-amine oxidase
VPVDPAVDGQPPILLEEYVLVDEIVKTDPEWLAAMARRGLTDVDLLRRVPVGPDNPYGNAFTRSACG